MTAYINQNPCGNGSPDDVRDRRDACPTAWIRLKALTQEILRRPGSRQPRHWFVLDELARELEAQQTEAKRRELAEQKVGADAKLTMARNQQELLLAQVGAATNALQQLLAGTDAVRANAAALRTNEVGRVVALHPDLVALAGRCYESQVPELVPEAEIITRLDGSGAAC